MWLLCACATWRAGASSGAETTTTRHAPFLFPGLTESSNSGLGRGQACSNELDPFLTAPSHLHCRTEDILGYFEARGGAIVEGSYVPNPNHRIVTGRGLFMLAGTAPSLRPPPSVLLFRADHPFRYVIRDRPSGAVLFVGRVSDPTQEG